MRPTCGSSASGCCSVRYSLLARPGAALQDVRTVLSHPQALAQCAGWLRETLPAADVQPRTSTAEAVREAATGDDDAVAALGTPVAGELYGAVVLAGDVGDDANVTRFVWLARADAPVEAADAAGWKSSLVFSGDGDGAPGWLVRCLSEFAAREVNLTRIESRPSRRRLGHYVFLLDLDGRADIPGRAGRRARRPAAALRGPAPDRVLPAGGRRANGVNLR